MGALLMEDGRNDEAIPFLEAAVKASPGTANQFALASAYIRTKQNDKAIPLMIAAANASPGNLNLLMTLGRLLRDTKRYPYAAQIFLRATQAEAKSKDAWSELGGVQSVTVVDAGPLVATLEVRRTFGAPFSMHNRAMAISTSEDAAMESEVMP